MSDLHPVILFAALFVFLLGAAIGHSVLQLRVRREENRRRELELALLEKRSAQQTAGAQAASDLEEELYKARVRQEIDDILSKS
ncbi:MAG: hypothetical protein JW699_00145 [Chitinispirillaceae bacterium]|nr:hypothetical protein [Chitinispirillaceae bacterium]